MTFLLLVMLAMATAPAPAAPVPKELKTPADAERMQGVWAEANGTRWYFDGKKLYAGGSNTTDKKGHEYDITLRPEGDVREFDLVIAGNVRFAGIYKFVGDDLHIVYNNGQVRPKDFESGAGSHKPILKRLAEAKK